uniref:Uncharacterized protein n=1 Tax=Anguilla anguilla TaxID=7936 RepID=A0A0E9U6Z9_ANGAN
MLSCFNNSIVLSNTVSFLFSGFHSK